MVHKSISVLILLALAAVGCSDSTKRTEEVSYTVKGRITKGGTPLPLDPVLAERKSARVEVRFERQGGEGGAGYSTMALANLDGTFEATEVPAGKYKIGVTHVDGKSPDALKGKFDARKSPIEREITGDTNLEIDLDKPQG